MRKEHLGDNGDGTSTTIHRNDGEFIIERTQDVAPILEQNKRAQLDGVNEKAGMRHAASVPMIIWQQWDKEFRERNQGRPLMTAPKKLKEKFIKLKLNDPANKFLRTWQGRV